MTDSTLFLGELWPLRPERADEGCQARGVTKLSSHLFYERIGPMRAFIDILSPKKQCSST